MRILFVGDLNPLGRTYQRLRALKELGHDVVAHPTEPGDLAVDQRPPPVRRVLWHLGFPPDLTKVNKTIVLQVEKHRPEVLWIEKGNTVWPRTLRAVKNLSPTTQIVSYTEDDMFRAHDRSLFYKWGLRHYDVVFTTQLYNVNEDELPSLGARRVVYVDKVYDIHAHRPVPVSAEDVDAFGGDVTFIGSYERERAESMLYLAQNGIPVRVWGSDWRRFLKRHPNLIIEYRGLYGDDYLKGLCASRINLGFLRKKNRAMQTDRTMEIPACGAFMLAERTDEQLRLFEEGKEAAYFGSNEELLEKVRYYLEHEDEREAIAAAGRQRCLTSDYSHHDRLKQMLAAVTGESQ